MSYISTVAPEPPQADSSPARCPYLDAGICRASFSTLVVDSRRRSGLCRSEDHDDCAIFIAKALRTHPPVGFSLQSREMEHK